MIRLLNIVLPPVPIFMAGKFIQGFINIGLLLLFWVPAVIHSWHVTTKHEQKKLVKELKKGIK